MKIFLSADWHLNDKKFHDPIRIEIGGKMIDIGEELYNKYITIQEILDIVREETPDGQERILVVAGDLKHDFYNVSVNASIILNEIFVSNDDINFYLLTGNHDLNKDGEGATNYLNQFVYLDNVNVIDTNVIGKVNGVDNLYMLPFNGDMDSVFEMLTDKLEIDDIDPSKRILVGHMDVNGFKMDNGFESSAPIKPKHLNDHFEITLLGHIHKPQNKNNIYYIGSPCQENISEADQNKRILSINTESLEISEYSLNKYKKYMIVDYKEIKDEDIEELNEKYKLIVNNCDDGDNIDLLIDLGVKYNMKSIDINQDDVSNTIDSSISQEEMFKEYLSINGKEEHKDSYMNYIYKIIGEVSE